MKKLSMWYSLWYWNDLPDWGRRATNRLGLWKGLKLTVEMPKMTVEMLKIWQISLPRWIFLSFGKRCKINACKWAKVILISLLFEDSWEKKIEWNQDFCYCEYIWIYLFDFVVEITPLRFMLPWEDAHGLYCKYPGALHTIPYNFSTRNC